MNNYRRKEQIKIVIKQVKDKEGEYLAYVHSSPLGATYSLLFKDNIMGAVALSSFYEMIKKRYDTSRVDFFVSQEQTDIKSQAVIDILRFHPGSCISQEMEASHVR